MPTANQAKHRALTVDEYFARLPSSECAEVCTDLIDGYYVEATRSGRVALYRTSFYDYYEGFLVKGQLYRKGAQGEQTGITINNYHNFIKHRVTMTCEQKLAYEPQAADGSHAAMEQIRLAKGLLSLYADRSDIDLDGRLRKAVQYSQMFMESWTFVLWDDALGKPVAVDIDNDNKLVPEGDVSIKVYDPLAVVRDVYRSEPADQWVILKEEVNKVDMAVQYPQFETEIMAQALEAIYKDRQIYPCYSPLSDIIWVWTLFHKNTLSVPAGRKLRFITPEIVLEDGPLPPEYCGELPGFRMAAEDLAGSPWGYSDTMDALPICNAISRLHSTALSNNITFGLQHILVPDNGNYTEASFGQGLSMITWPAEKGPAFKPEALQLTSTAKETYEYIGTLTQTVGTLMGINESTRGNPDLVLKGPANAEAMVIMSTQAIQFNSDLGKAYNKLAENVGTAIIKILAAKSVVPRQGRKLGMSGKPYSSQFKGDDLKLIDKVSVKVGNPLSQTTSGRLAIAKSLLDAGFIKNHQEYMQVLETGNLEPMLQASEMEMALIKDENDAMDRGEMVNAIVFDDHVTHIPEHKCGLSSVEARRNPQILKVRLAHIQQHIDFLAGNAKQGPMNPILATIGGQPTLPPGTPDQIILPKLPGAPKPPGLPPGPPKPGLPGKPPLVKPPGAPAAVRPMPGKLPPPPMPPMPPAAPPMP